MNHLFRFSILGFITLFSLNSCSDTTSSSDDSNQEEKEAAPITAKEFDEMSIFQLPSEWESQEDKLVKLEDLQGNILVAVMIYTTCKAACPRLVADMKNIQSQIGTATQKPVKYLLFSIDPETDTPEQLKKFSIENEMAENHWLFLRSSEENTREFANVLAVKYAEISPIDFSHSNIISVFDTEGIMQHQQEGLGVDNKETIAKIIELAG